MKNKLILFLVCISVAVLCFSGKLDAQTLFDWSFRTFQLIQDGTPEFSGSGTLEASPTGNPNGSYLVSSITGTFYGLNISSLLATNQFTAFPGPGNDNLIYPGAAILVDSNGIAFEVGNGVGPPVGSGVWDIADLFSSVYGAVEQNGGGGAGSFNLSAVPEPSSYALLGLVVLTLVVAARRRVT